MNVAFVLVFVMAILLNEIDLIMFCFWLVLLPRDNFVISSYYWDW